MRRAAWRRLVTVTVVVVMSGAAGRAVACDPESGRTVTRSYSVPKNVEVDPPYGWVGGEYDRVEFYAGDGDRRVTVTVNDLTGTATPFTIIGGRDEPYPFFGSAYCGTATFTIEPGAYLAVYPMAGFVSAGHGAPVPACPGVATQGTVTATFRS